MWKTKLAMVKGQKIRQNLRDKNFVKMIRQKICQMNLSKKFVIKFVIKNHQKNLQRNTPKKFCYINLDWFSWEWSKKLFLSWKKKSKWPTQKNWVFQPPPKAEQLSPKFYRLVLGNSRIDWWEGHQCDSTYMVVRLSDVSPK